ncbi:phosphoribosylanthranilate isomerase [Rufibacter sp. LB8]|uniref:phosphoribosylanthranilate isomerase n=1 Tax=Rufibacter sp. LB8 TaxID=2777781 RepID=UPI00178C7ADC|nr:phosphoribosylanthranilate isomerase [Rufibacter sp. LB8]
MATSDLKIKVCGMKYSENLEELLELQPDYVGFIFYDKSPRCVAGQEEEIAAATKPDVTKVGVFVDEKKEVIQQKVDSFGLGMVQLHGHESSQFCGELKDAGLTVMKAFRIGEDFDFEPLKAYAGVCDFFLFDASGPSPGGNGVRFNWQMLERYDLDVPFFLSGGIDVEHLQEIKALHHPKLFGLDLNSKFEISPGLKNIHRLKEFMEDLRV